MRSILSGRVREYPCSWMVLFAIGGSLLCPLFPAIAHPTKITVPADGKKFIRSIQVKLKDVFEDPDGFLYKAANDIKIQTKQQVILNELSFKVGDTYNPFALKESERNLRLLRYLREVWVRPTFDGDAVDVLVEAQDTWTLVPQLSYSGGTGQKNRGIGVAEGNFLGTATRVDARYQENSTRESYGLIVNDPQFLGTRNRGNIGYISRSDGEIFLLGGGLPFRSLVQEDSWSFDIYHGDTVGRLFDRGTEEYIFRQKNENYQVSYTFAGTGSVQHLDGELAELYRGLKIFSNRYSVGWEYQADSFLQATADDYEDLDLDPNEVSNDPTRLASDRRFSGPVLRYQQIEPIFIQRNYIDRFDRWEDYNLGDETLVVGHFAGRMFGSHKDNIILTANRSRGWQFSSSDFLKAEVGLSSRLTDGSLENSLLRAEIKYYNVLGDFFAGDIPLGRHTFVASAFIDFGEDLDRDRQFLVGSDNALRGYDANTFEGDKRVVINLEERAHFADDVLKLFSVGGAVFLDAGGATRDTLGSIITSDLYSDAGFGLRFGFPRSSGGGVARIDIAFPLRDGPDGSGQFEPRIIFSAGQLFGAKLRSEEIGAENATSAVGFDR